MSGSLEAHQVVLQCLSAQGCFGWGGIHGLTRIVAPSLCGVTLPVAWRGDVCHLVSKTVN